MVVYLRHHRYRKLASSRMIIHANELNVLSDVRSLSPWGWVDFYESEDEHFTKRIVKRFNSSQVLKSFIGTKDVFDFVRRSIAERASLKSEVSSGLFDWGSDLFFCIRKDFNCEGKKYFSALCVPAILSYLNFDARWCSKEEAAKIAQLASLYIKSNYGVKGSNASLDDLMLQVGLNPKAYKDYAKERIIQALNPNDILIRKQLCCYIKTMFFHIGLVENFDSWVQNKLDGRSKLVLIDRGGKSINVSLREKQLLKQESEF